jgi:hypothetical protein
MDKRLGNPTAIELTFQVGFLNQNYFNKAKKDDLHIERFTRRHLPEFC